eukprot:511221-Rhodomonas_salina.3
MARMGPKVGHAARRLAIRLGKGKSLSACMVGESRGSGCCIAKVASGWSWSVQPVHAGPALLLGGAAEAGRAGAGGCAGACGLSLSGGAGAAPVTDLVTLRGLPVARSVTLLQNATGEATTSPA